MSNVGIVTDTVNCLPAELIKEYGIREVPINLVIDGKSYRDQVNITPAEFWRIFPEMKNFTTSVPSIGDFAEIYQDLGKSTDSIICIVVSRGLSAVYESAFQAVEIVRADNPSLNIEVIDSRTAAGALGFIVLEAACAARAGKSLPEVVRTARDMIPKVKFVIAMETLKYIIKSGRAPKAAVIGDLLQIKPIIGMVNNTGKVENISKARGNQKAMEKLAEILEEYLDTNKPVHLIVHYTDNIENGEKLRDIATARLNCAEVYLTPFTPVMAGHTGPVLALSGYT